MRFHLTKHFTQRISERNLSVEDIKAVVRSPDKKRILKQGPHGGDLIMFQKTVDEVTLKVVAEIKRKDCWLVSAYHPWEN